MSSEGAGGPSREARQDRALVVTSLRSGRLGSPPGIPAREPSADEVAAAGGSAPRCWLARGEPTLRPDLPELVAALRRPGRAIGLETDGLRLADERAAARLREAGLDAVRIALHSARPDAHDFVSGIEGSARRAVRAIAVCRDVGLAVEAWIAATRQTLPHLAETVEVLSRLGVRDAVVRRLSSDQVASAEFLLLSPRLVLAAADLAALARARDRLGIGGAVQGFPPCVLRRAPGLRGGGAAADVLDPSTGLAVDPAVEGCGLCDEPACPGAPADYVGAFGWEELERLGEAGRPRPPGPPRAPADVAVAFCAPTPLLCRSCAAPVAPSAEPVREACRRLVAAARSGDVLRIVGAGSLRHPEALELVGEAVATGCDRVELAAEGTALAALSDDSLRGLSRSSRLDVALFGPDAAAHDAHCGCPGGFDAALGALARAAALAGVPVEAFAVLHEARALVGFASAWARGQLPGRPRFRLASAGGSLDELASVARTLDPPEARPAIERLLPPCLRDAGEGGDARAAAADAGACATAGVFGIRGGPARVSAGVDPRGRFRPCRDAGECAAAGACPGIAEGWTAVETRPLATVGARR
jgi:MoaA/NifB/PqqE/SkfB family radical SAM enzyme